MKNKQEVLEEKYRSFLNSIEDESVPNEPNEDGKKIIEKLRELLHLSKDADYQEVLTEFEKLPNSQTTLGMMTEVFKTIKQEV